MTDPLPPPLHPGLGRVLLVCPSWVGDTVMATPVMRALRETLPDTHLAALVRPGLDDVLRGTPWLDEVIVCPRGGWTGPLTTARRLRDGRYDATLVLPNSLRSALTVRLAGIPVRIGYRRDGRSPLLTHPVAAPPRSVPEPLLHYYGRLAAGALGLPAVEGLPELAVTTEEADAATTLLDGLEGPLVLLNPGANNPAKRWPTTQFAAVARRLAAKGISVAVTGGPGERDLVAAVAAEGHARDLVAAGITLGALKGVIARADLLITNDTGPRHFAAALGTPTVVLYGPTDPRWTTLPGVREHALVAEPFLPEELAADKHPKLCRIDRISEGDVLAAVESLLAARGG